MWFAKVCHCWLKVEVHDAVITECKICRRGKGIRCENPPPQPDAHVLQNLQGVLMTGGILRDNLIGVFLGFSLVLMKGACFDELRPYQPEGD